MITYASNCFCYDRCVDFVSVLDVSFLQLHCTLLEGKAVAHCSVTPSSPTKVPIKCLLVIVLLLEEGWYCELNQQ